MHEVCHCQLFPSPAGIDIFESHNPDFSRLLFICFALRTSSQKAQRAYRHVRREFSECNFSLTIYANTGLY